MSSPVSSVPHQRYIFIKALSAFQIKLKIFTSFFSYPSKEPFFKISPEKNNESAFELERQTPSTSFGVKEQDP